MWAEGASGHGKMMLDGFHVDVIAIFFLDLDRK